MILSIPNILRKVSVVTIACRIFAHWSQQPIQKQGYHHPILRVSDSIAIHSLNMY